MKTPVVLTVAAILALSLMVATTQALAISPPAPGGTPGPPGTSGTPSGPGAGAGPQDAPGAQATANALAGKGKPMLYRGTISAVDAASLTLTLGDGSSVTIGLTGDTKIKIPGSNSQGNSLVVGMQAIAWAFTDVNGNLVARMVIAIPGKPTIVHRVGTVTEYTAASSITIMASDGNLYTFALTAGTRFLPAERAADLAVGSRVTVIAPRDPGALGWTASGIVIHPSK